MSTPSNSKVEASDGEFELINANGSRKRFKHNRSISDSEDSNLRDIEQNQSDDSQEQHDNRKTQDLQM